MNFQQVFQQCLPIASALTPAEIDAEIREELEFHLDMRTQDNLRAGMSAEEARNDAQRRFGDFEASRRECRKISLGHRILFQRLQTALLVALIGTVIYQGMLLFRLQADSQVRIEALAQMVEQLQAARKPVWDEAAVMPNVYWNFEPRQEAATVEVASVDDLAAWNTTKDPLSQPWSNWESLEGPGEEH